MNVYEVIEILNKIKDKKQEIFFDITPIDSESFIFKSIDVIEEIENDQGHSLVVVSCGLEDSNDFKYSLN